MTTGKPLAGVRVLLCGANAEAGLAAVRSLGRAGARVDVGAAVRTSHAWSRFARRSLRHPDPLRSSDAFVAWTLRESDRETVVLPVDDPSTLALVDAVAAGTLDRCVAAPAAAAVRTSLDKRALNEAARAAGVRVPDSIEVTEPSEAAAVAAALGPVVVKSVGGLWFAGDSHAMEGGRVVRCASPADAERATRDIVQVEGRALVQPLVAGDEYGVGAVRWPTGDLVTACQRRLRSWPPTGGPPALARTVEPPPGVIDAVDRLLASLAWSGAAQLDVMVGPDGATVLDLNARLWLSVQLTIAAGVDVPVLAVEVALGRPAPTSAPGRVGVGWASAEAEVRYVACLVTNQRGVRQPGETLATAWRRWRNELRAPVAVDPIDFRDPVPTLTRLGAVLPWTIARRRVAAWRSATRRSRATPAPAGVTIEVRPRLAELAGEWDSLVDTTPHASVFLRSWWLDATADEATEFVIVRRAGEFLGGVALQRDQRLGVDRYGLAGLPIAHGVDAVAVPHAADAVVEALREWFARPGSRMFDLEGPTPGSLVARAAPPGMRVEELERAPFIRLTGDFEAYLATRSRHRRQDIRRTLRRLAARGVVYRVVPASDVDRALEALDRTHRSRWGARSVFTDSFERFRRAATKGVAIGVMAFHEAVHDEEVVGSLVTIDHGDVCAFYQMGRDPDSLFSQSSGTLLKARAIERAVDHGFAVVDLCYGDPRAKTEWADDAQRVLALRWSVGPRGHAVRALRRTIGPTVRRLRARRQRAAEGHRKRSGRSGSPVGPGEARR